MVKAIRTSITEGPLVAFNPSLENPAVALCAEVWQNTNAATLKQTKSVYNAKSCAGEAYRLAMPPLSGYQNICDFIACVAYGMLLGAIKDENGTKLLYAAQIALAAVSRESKTSKNETRPAPLLPSDPTPSPTFSAPQ